MHSGYARDFNCRVCRRHNGCRMYKLTPDGRAENDMKYDKGKTWLQQYL
jgi:hypothetical protein